MSRRAPISDHLAAVPMFSACNRRELQAVSRLTTERDVPAGKFLTRQGELGHEFVIVIAGNAVVERDGKAVGHLGDGDFFGEIALLDGGERTATVRAETPMVLAVVSQRDFSQLLDEVPSLSRKIMRGLAGQIRQLTSPPVAV